MTGLVLRYRDQRGRCFYCRRTMSFTQRINHPDGLRITREHLIPKSKGGRGGANIVAARYRCNTDRRDTSWLSFYCSPRVSRMRALARRAAASPDGGAAWPPPCKTA